MAEQQRIVIERGVADAYAPTQGSNDPPSLCATFSARSVNGSDVWIQVLAGSVNTQYPLDEEPLEALRARGIRSPAGLEIIDWQASVYATFAVPDTPARDVAYFVDQLFTRVLDCDDGTYVVSVAIENLDA